MIYNIIKLRDKNKTRRKKKMRQYKITYYTNSGNTIVKINNLFM